MADGDTSFVAWATKLNRRWIVHHGLNERAKEYMDYLAAADPSRLERSCWLAHELAHQASGEDPKPWFYAGLFSLATVEEARKFLASHWLTLSALPCFTGEFPAPITNTTVGQAARDKLERIQQALSRLRTSAPDNS